MNEYPRSIKLKRVTEDDLRVTKEIDKEHKKADSNNRVFGEYALEAYEDWDKRLQKLHDEGEDSVPWSQDDMEQFRLEHLDMDRRVIKERLEGEDLMVSASVEMMFFNYLNSQRAERRGHDLRDYLYIDDGDLDINIDDMPNDLLIDILSFHREYMAEQRKEMAKDVEIWKGEFIGACLEGIQAGWLPISEESLKKRVAETKVVLRDDMIVETSLGEWRKWVSTIHSWMDKEQRRRTIFHELVHGLAGRALAEEQYTTHFPDRPHTRKEVKFQRTGLRYNYGYQKGIQKPGIKETSSMFRWLNEAVTEKVAMRLLGLSESNSYKKERVELSKIVDAGVDEQLFINAYFEDFDPEAPRTKKVPAFRALIKEVHAKMGKGYLKQIDKKLK